MTSENTPVTVEQITDALIAFGMYEGENTPEQHAEYAARNGSADIYRVRMINALLGVVQREAILADEVELDEENKFASWAEQIKAADAWDNLPERIAFIAWQIERAVIPLRIFAPEPGTGAIPIAAVQAAEGLHTMLGVMAGMHAASAVGDLENMAFQLEVLKAGRNLLQAAIDNTDAVLAEVEAANQ